MHATPGIEWIERALALLPSWRSARSKCLGVLAIALTFTFFSNASQEAYAAPAAAHTCAAKVGLGGAGSATLSQTKGGDGCVVIKYTSSGTTYFETFNYTGVNQSWTVPTLVTTATFYLIGAGGGGGAGNAAYGDGGGGGFVSGAYSVTAGSALTIIVGEGGGGKANVGAATPATFGGGGTGSSFNGMSNSYASGGGRSAIRLSGASTDLATAAGGGGGGYGGCGAGGGGDTGGSGTPNPATGGTQSAGGTGGFSINGYPGTAGSAYLGGNSRDEGGGGGGGYFGGGGGGDNGGGGGGSSYKTLLTGGITTAGASCGVAGVSTGLGYTISYDANGATSGTTPANTQISVTGGGTLASNTGTLARTGFVFAGWNTSADGAGTSYAVASTTFTTTADTTLYAQWNSTITYNTNTATGTVPTAVITKGSASGTFALNSGSGLTKTGLTFAGWNTAANGSGTNYAGSETYTSSGDITLYAVFRPIYTYNANGASSGTVPASILGTVAGCITDPGLNNCKVFSYTGIDQQFIIPADIDTSKGVLVEAWGAGGGGTIAYSGGPGGAAGGYSKATLTTPTLGEVLKIVVGEGGLKRDQTAQYGGGGIGGLGAETGSTGGGYSGIFTGTTPLVISGAGGGASPGSGTGGTAGGGGGANQNGGQAGTAGEAGRGGTNSAGGAGATGNPSCPTTGSAPHDGSSLQGGASCDKALAEGGGGGGGGYFGGGGGTYQTSGGGPGNGGGGGGSGYLDSTRGTLIANLVGSNGVINDFAYPSRTSVNYANNAGRGGKGYSNTVADNSGGNGLITIQWSSPTGTNPVANNTGNLAKVGYTFAGWNTAADGTGTTYAPGEILSATISTTLYAIFTANNYSVRFDANGGSGTMADSAIVAGTAKNLTANAFTRVGYSFQGWTTNSNGTGTTYTNSQSVTLYADTVLYAKWLGNTYSVTFGNTPGTVGSTNPCGCMPAQSFTAGTPFTLNASDWYRTGYILAGWSTVSGNGSPIVYADRATVTLFANTTIYTQWNPVYTVTFSANSGTGTAPTALAQAAFGGAVTLPVTTAMTRAGFIAAGWNTAADGSGTSYAAGASYTPSAATTLYVKWNIVVTYLANGGSGSAPTAAIATISGGVNSVVVANANTLTRTRYTFAGWNTLANGSGTNYAVGSTFNVTTSVSLYAQWNSTITYNANTSANTTGTVPSPTIAKSSESVTALSVNSGNLARTGYTFGGWNTQADGRGTSYPASGGINGLPNLYMRFQASDFDVSTTVWLDSSGFNRNIPDTATTGTGVFSRVTTTPNTNGTTAAFTAVAGGTLTKIVFGNPQLTKYTLCHVSRYSGAAMQRIFTDASVNWLSGYLSGAAGTSYHIGGGAGGTLNDTNWRVMCDYGAYYRNNGATGINTLGVTYLPANLGVNIWSTQQSDWEIADVLIFDSELTVTQIQTLEAYLKGVYGLTNVTAASGAITANYASSGGITLYAQWNCQVTYNANSATSGTVPAPTATTETNTVTLATNSGTLARTNYLFIGWNTMADGSGTAYATNTSLAMSGNLTLYAQWGSTITYNANGATTGTVPANTYATGTASINLAPNSGTLAKTGTNFAGWNTAANGSGTSYIAGSTYTPSGNATLYALWLSNCVSSRSVVGGFVIETFTQAGTCYWLVPPTATSIDYLVVGGGGGGGSSLGGGGGGGQVILSETVTASGGAIIKIGAGGAGGVGGYTATTNHGKTGGSSAFLANNLRDIALGGSGGNGRMSATNLNPDGSAISTGWAGGGGAYFNSPAEVAIAGVGGNAYIGGTGSGNGGAGGGGAGGVGANSAATAAGGAGVSKSISGTATFYGGGGGGGKYGGTTWTGAGGSGGGGAGSKGTNTALAAGVATSGNGENGIAGTGGGGGGGYEGGTGGTGGAGLLIVRYEVGTPSAPTITAITPTSGQLSVAFTPPVSDGGATISNYQYSTDGGATWVTPSPVQTTSPLVITGLTNGTTFPVVIRALNGKTGVSSNTVSGTTPLSAPTISAVAGNANATISVTAGSGATPTSYLVTALNSSGVALAGPITCTVTSPATSCVMSGLTNNTAYKFSAVAIKGALTSPTSNVTTAVTPTTYVVTYVANNSTANTTAEFTTGTPLVLPLLTRAGYNFTGWFTAASGGTLVGQNGSSYSPTSAITLQAQWAGIAYTVTYSGNGNNGGTVPSAGTYTSGGASYTVTAFSGVLTKSGYTLMGWNSKSDGTGVDYGPGLANTSYSASANITLYAKWTFTNYTVTYSLNTGLGTLPTSGTKIIGETFTVASAAGITKATFSFGGWSDGTAVYRAGSTYITGTSNIVLTARWIALRMVTFDANGATAGNAPAVVGYVDGDPGITLPGASGLSKSGYVFAGWSTTPTGSVESSPFTTGADVILYAKWTLATVAINFASGLAGGVAPTLAALPATTSASFGALYTMPTTDATTSTSGGNFVFVGWSDGTTTYRAGDTYRMGSAPPTFTAQWVAIYTVRYSLNGGTSSVPADVTYTSGTAITTAVAPSRTGYNFVQWIDQSDETVGAASAYTVRDAHYLLYAVWSPVSYNITFSDNSVAGVSGIPVAQSGNIGQVVGLTGSAPSRSGYIFDFWSISSNGSGTRFGPGAQLLLGSGDVTLYANWRAASNAIIYSGTTTSGALPNVQAATTGATVNLAMSSGFARAGYTFDKWSDGISLYVAGATFEMPVSNTLLTAQWLLNAPNVPAAPTAVSSNGSATITVVPGSGSGGAATSYTVTASPSGLTCTVYAPATSCVISGLANGTSYTFTSTATNSSGTAGPSPASSAITPATKPTVVSSVAAVAGNANAAVTFVAPESDGGSAITSYVVTSSPGGFTCTVNAPFTPPIGCTVSGLTNGTAYSFTVRANNGAFTSDTSSASVPVTPMTVPGAPSLSAATSSTTSPGSATITITPPASNGGDTITAYIVTSSPGGLTCIAYAPATTCEVTGLTPGVAYTFTAVAQNSVPGSSANSAPSNAVTPVSKPSPPTNVVAAAGDDQATVSFTAPANNGSAILSYKVIALTVDGVPLSPEVSCTPAPGATSCVLSPLVNGTGYRFSVTATNAVGTSIPSATSAVATPEDQFAPRLLTSGVPAGVDIVGNVLTVSMIFEGAPTPTVTYQWQRCTDPSDLTTCANIAGAIASTYTTTSADATTYIRVQGTAVNGVSPSAVSPSALTAEITGVPRATTPTTGLTANINQAYSLATVAFGGAAPLVYAITSGTLPAGLNFDSTNGNITGSPTSVGSATLTISATDQKGQTSSITFTISVVDPNAVAPSAPASPAYVPPAPSPTPADTSAADAAAKAAAEKALADKAAADAAAKAAADAVAKSAADKAAAAAAAKALADQAAAIAAAKAAADKLAASKAAQAAADKAAADAAARKAVAAKAVAAAADAAAKAAVLAKTPAVTTAAKNAAAAAAQIAQTQAAAAVKSAAQAAVAEVATKSAAAVKANDVTISIGSLTSALNSAASSAKSDAAAKAAQVAADATAKSAAADAVTAKNSATAAAKAAADAVAAAAVQQKASADALAAAQQKADALAAVVAANAAAEIAEQKAVSALAAVLAQRAEISSKLATSLKPAERASAEKELAAVEDKLDAAQEIVDKAVEQVEVLGVSQEKLEQGVIVAAAAAETQVQLATLATKVADTKSDAAEKASAKAIVANVAATAAKATAKTIATVKTKAPTVAAKGVRSDALINITGLKPGQKIRVSVKVNIK